ncbi:MAG: hypothetical protein COT38_04370 [Candidatus Omnitrophica bacterium CG08_land_8_20_14_0_20_41_16]|uniref:SH3b domain-containing protein n=1 Tax=Candidatus Sherwoodlollariibacterium unditelluris TaxID=1974757 RepID=A0A2G9YMV2_9BACT|nr:MAG: hypothetical protein COX41_00745 [Candidatus Omnitrophica bacterium CG23_combo_of_CG06-09_8_20_14_all_41_10]PIS33611.1 MAG: hypothetical protein COT38_04370 [Candidatus Omnitrophica bacterium CG08_land_8_20_14_0_20_41_16]
MHLRLSISVLLAVIFIFLLSLSISAAWENAPFLGEINTNNINLRSDATIGSKVICTLDKGEQVEVVSEAYEWYKPHLPAHISVYLKGSLADCIKYKESVEGNKEEVCLSAKVLRDRVNVRVSPDESSAIVGIANKNEIVNVRGETGGWYKIEPIQNSFGWVNKKFVNKVEKAVSVNKNEDKKESLNSNENIVLKGIVNPYGIVFRRIATHKLITADNKVFLLKGNKAALDALNRNKVKVIGKIISPPKAKYPLVEVIIIEAEN